MFPADNTAETVSVQSKKEIFEKKISDIENDILAYNTN